MIKVITVANGIDIALSSIDTAMTVLDAAIEQACRVQKVKPENASDYMWTQEIKYLNNLMTAAYCLMKEPVESLEDVKGAAFQLVETEKAGDPA